MSRYAISNEMFGLTKTDVLELCLMSEFPGTKKWPGNHPIWFCHIAHKKSPYDAWKDESLLKKAIDNLFWITQKSILDGKYPEFVLKIKSAFETKINLCEVVLNRFTVAKIAPKVTALAPARLYAIIKESKIDLSNGVYCPMAGFGGIIEGAKRWYKDHGISDYDKLIEAYDINLNFCEYFSWKQRDALAQIVETEKVVIACPPFGPDTERWEGTPDNMYYSFEEWCKLLKEHIKAPNYIFIGPETYSKNKCGLFSHKFGVQLYKEQDLTLK